MAGFLRQPTLRSDICIAKNPPDFHLAGFYFNYREAGKLDSLNFLGLRALLAFSSNVGNALVFFERFEARTQDVCVMNEQVFTTRLRLDEAEALFVVEPFNNTGFCLHVCNP